MTQHILTNKKRCPFCAEDTICTKKIRLFNALPEDSQDELIQNATHTKYLKGQTITEEGDEIQKVLVIRKGRIKTVRTDASGEEYILDILHEGQAIWHDMFLQDHFYHYSIIAITDVEMCEIKRDEFMHILAKSPESAMSLITMLSTELSAAKEKGILLAIRDPLHRLAGFLLDKDKHCTGNEIQMKLDDIASSISLRPETISRGISKLEKEGFIVRKGNGKLKVTDRYGLKNFFLS